MRTILEGNILGDSKITIDNIIATLDQIGAVNSKEAATACNAATDILYAISKLGAKTAEEALDIIRDYRLLVKPDITLEIVREYRSLVREGYILQEKYTIADKPLSKDGVWHCPDCNGRCKFNHSFCHHCGKRLDWR